ncbi:MAG: tryptophan synthase subunit alpha [Castellaniella sp.]
MADGKTSSNARILAAFERTAGRAALVPYVTAGDPSIEAMPRLMHAMVDAGADIIELGVPFSDPMADGPVIQLAAERAIARGTSLATVLDMVAQFRRDDDVTPVVLMGYANPIERMGQEAFVQRAAQAGVDGMLVVDYPPEEAGHFAALLADVRIDPIFLLAPTSTAERMQALARMARGYVYYVSLKGVTGSAALDTEAVARRLEEVRRHISIPVGVGFGIRDAQSAQQIGKTADAVVIGSRLIELMQAAARACADGGGTPAQADDAAIGAVAQWLREVRSLL